MPSSLRTRSATSCFASALLAGLIASSGCHCGEPEPSRGCAHIQATANTTGSGGTVGSGGVTSGSGGSGAIGGSGGSGGSGAIGGSGGSGGPPDECPGGVLVESSGTDTCPGEIVVLDVGDKYCLRGDTSLLADDYSSFACGGTTSDGPEAVYAFDIKAPGSLKVVVRATAGSTLDPSIYARAPDGCSDETVSSSYGCWAFFGTDHEEYALHQPAAELSYLFIDGANGSSGAYEVIVEHTMPECGDAVLNPGEECDDGNKWDNDGCSNGCKLQLVSLFDQCDGEPAVLFPNQALAFVGDTTPYGDDYIAPAIDGCSAKAGGKDRVYRVTPAGSGTITASIGYDVTGTIDVCAQNGLLDPGCWNRLIYVVGPDQCDDGMGALGPAIACSQGGFGVAQVAFPAQSPKEYYIIVDGNGQAEHDHGSYYLIVELTP